MPPTQAPQIEDATAFVATVRQLSAHEGIRVQVRERRSDRGGASAWAGRKPRITVGPATLQQPPAVQRWVAAHEMGHIVASHSIFRTLGISFSILAVWSGLVVAAVELLPTAVLAWRHLKAVMIMSGIGSGIATVWLFTALSRRSERVADSYACGHGFHMPSEAVTWLKKHEGRLYRVPVVSAALRTHDRPARRLRACNEH